MYFAGEGFHALLEKIRNATLGRSAKAFPFEGKVGFALQNSDEV